MINTNSQMLGDPGSLGEMITHCIKVYTSWRRATEVPSSVIKHRQLVDQQQQHLHRAFLLLETSYDEMSGWENTNTTQEFFPELGKPYASEDFFSCPSAQNKREQLTPLKYEA